MLADAEHPAHCIDRGALGKCREDEHLFRCGDSFVCHDLNYSTLILVAQQENVYIFKPMKKKSHGGKREGAGRPSQGKARYNVMLTAGNVTKAREREGNFSGLLDGLLADWLNR